MTRIVKEWKAGQFTVRIIANEHDDYSVVSSAGDTRLETYDCEDLGYAERDFSTVCETIRNVRAVLRQSLE